MSDKLIKIIFEDEIPLEMKYGALPETTVVKRIIQDMRFNDIMNTQVYRTLKGQLYHDNLNDVVNFIKKYGYGERFDKYDRVIMTCTIGKKYKVANDLMYGVVHLE